MLDQNFQTTPVHSKKNQDKQTPQIEAKKGSKSTLYLNKIINLLLKNDYLQLQLNEMERDILSINERIKNLENTVETHFEEMNNLPKKEMKKKRRMANQVERSFKCPYPSCQKIYGTDISLNLHIRLKHNGGSKIEREELAVKRLLSYLIYLKQKLLMAKMTGDQPPEHDINLPPNFLEEFCQTYALFTQQLEEQFDKKIILT